MDKYKEMLNKKVFGVKVLYLALVFVGILAFVAYKMKSAGVSTGAEDVADDGETGDVGSPDYSGLATGGTTGVVSTPAPTPTPETPAPETPDDPVYEPPPATPTNDTWLRQGIDFLIKQGVPSDQATSALQTYLAGDQLSYEQGKLRERVIQRFGLPPDIPASGGTANKPTTPVAPPKVTPQTQKPPTTFVVTKGINTLTAISRKFYGSTADRYIDLLQVHNMNIGRAGPYKVGTRVYVPAKREPRFYVATRSTRTLAAIAKKNGISQAVVKEYNDLTKFPVPVGKKVRVA